MTDGQFRFPRITGEGNREKIEQIIRFLYGLIEQLNLEMLGGNFQNSAPIIETGESGGWRYVRDSDGFCRICGSFSPAVSAASMTASDSGLCVSDPLTIPLPFPVTDGAVIATGAGQYWIVGAHTSSPEAVTFRVMSDRILAESAITVHLFVSGRQRLGSQ